MTLRAVGDTIPSREHLITEDVLRRYAEVAGDANPIHLDAAYAATTPFGGIVAHGMLVLGYLGDALSQAFGPAWNATGALSVRFKAPVRLGEYVTTGGAVTSVEHQDDGQMLVRCSVFCRTRGADEPVITGDASVRLPG